MKTLLTLILFLTLIKFSKSQDTTLPQGNGCIYLKSGKLIKNIRLWRIDTSRIEFVQEGNLHDVRIVDVNQVAAGEYIFWFDDEHEIIMKRLDMIVLYNGDTLYGCIQKISDFEITYILTGNNKKKNPLRLPVKSYVKRNAVPYVFESKNQH